MADYSNPTDLEMTHKIWILRSSFIIMHAIILRFSRLLLFINNNRQKVTVTDAEVKAHAEEEGGVSSDRMSRRTQLF